MFLGGFVAYVCCELCLPVASPPREPRRSLGPYAHAAAVRRDPEARAGAAQAAVLLNMEPLVGSLLGVTLLREFLGPLGYVGGAMILTGSMVMTTTDDAHSSSP
jgi:hypothetical protein